MGSARLRNLQNHDTVTAHKTIERARKYPRTDKRTIRTLSAESGLRTASGIAELQPSCPKLNQPFELSEGQKGLCNLTHFNSAMC